MLTGYLCRRTKVRIMRRRIDNNMKKFMKMAVMTLAVVGALAVMPSAQASVLNFTLNQDGCTGTCGTGPFGNITLTDNGSGGVTVLLTLAAGMRFAGGGAGDALEFNAIGPISNINNTTDFAVGPAPNTASVFGTFLESIVCTTCQGGQAGNSPGPLSFTVGNVNVNSFVANAGGYFFASDIVGNNGNTGNVAAKGPSSSVPEPISLSLVGGGLLALGLFRKRFVA
jgi:hypothetical protein